MNGCTALQAVIAPILSVYTHTNAKINLRLAEL